MPTDNASVEATATSEDNNLSFYKKYENALWMSGGIAIGTVVTAVIAYMVFKAKNRKTEETG